ncbi:DUF397 domain-containing protein [Streptomyces albogriseolus]|uniref:DUF397 domain-containing protein n=1 Tax=Streptomyces albogriseolus TaxID=1887 RepID=UPI0033AE5F50
MGRTTQRESGTGGRRGPAKERPAAWSAYGKLVRLFRERAGLTQQALADAIGYSMEQGSYEHRRAGSEPHVVQEQPQRNGGDCVEVAVREDTVYVRDSKAVEAGPVLRVGRGRWAAFVALAAERSGAAPPTHVPVDRFPHLLP